MEKYKVKLIDGTEVEAEIYPLSYIDRNEIMKLSTKTKMSRGSTESEFDMFTLQTETIKRCVKGVDLNKLTAESGDELFLKFFGSVYGMGNTQGNLETSSELQ